MANLHSICLGKGTCQIADCSKFISPGNSFKMWNPLIRPWKLSSLLFFFSLHSWLNPNLYGFMGIRITPPPSPHLKGGPALRSWHIISPCNTLPAFVLLRFSLNNTIFWPSYSLIAIISKTPPPWENCVEKHHHHPWNGTDFQKVFASMAFCVPQTIYCSIFWPNFTNHSEIATAPKECGNDVYTVFRIF